MLRLSPREEDGLTMALYLIVVGNLAFLDVAVTALLWRVVRENNRR